LPSESATPSFVNSAKKLITTFSKEKLQYMFIGGFALPAYGQIRTTQDIDIAIAATKMESLERLLEELRKSSFETTAKAQMEAACICLLDRQNLVDVELWLKPDGVIFDNELLSRRRKIELAEDLNIWVIGPEDFIVNKLARTDRSIQDERDIVTVLIKQKGKLDYEYLEERAREFEVIQLLKSLQRRIGIFA
jgi:hypothetical protein